MMAIARRKKKRRQYGDKEWEIICGDALTELRKIPDGLVQCAITSPAYWGLRDYGIEGQLGLEPTPKGYVDSLVEVFRELRRVLRNDGIFWLNIGDCYARESKHTGRTDAGEGFGGKDSEMSGPVTTIKVDLGNIKTKDLIGIPWMLAFALREDGWWLRSEVIWHKPNPMSESSLYGRPSKSHEQVFMLTKSPECFYDAEAAREKEGRGRTIRDVWTIKIKPNKNPHFAQFPLKLVEPCIKLGTPERGSCSKCGSPQIRVTKKVEGKSTGEIARRKTIGFKPSCECGAEAIPALVMDPFSGFGTVGIVALEFGRRYLGIELNPEYAELSRNRLRFGDHCFVRKGK